MTEPDGSSPPPAPAPSPTPTPSLRRRATVIVLGLFAVLLLLVGLAVDVALGRQLREDLQIRLADRADRAVTLAQNGFDTQRLVSLVEGGGILVTLTTSDGTVLGSANASGEVPSVGGPAGRKPPGPPPPPPAAGGPPPPPGPGGPRPGGALDGPLTSLTRALPDGSKMTLVSDATVIEEVRSDLRLIMAVAGALTLLLAAGALGGGISAALRPLDAMTALAQRITAGDRGRRLRPDQPGSELGRAAGAFDVMLDALEAAEAHERAAAQAARAAEERARSFLADAAHELRTPVAGIRSLVELLARDTGADPERATRFTALLLRESEQAVRLVTDMLDLARIDAGVRLDIAMIDLIPIVDAEVDRARLLAPSLTVRRSGAEAVMVAGDAGRITQILGVLLSNARRHTPPGGLIDVSAIAVGAAAHVTVTDTGPGVDDAERERIFERLVRLSAARDRDSGGAGLGLSIARGLARAHGGDLTCEASVAGASFRLVLPLRTP